MALMLSRMTFRELMAEYGILKQRDLVRLTAMSKQQVWLLWHGRVNVGHELGERLAGQLNIPIERILTLDHTRRPRQRRPGRPRKNQEGPTHG